MPQDGVTTGLMHSGLGGGVLSEGGAEVEGDPAVALSGTDERTYPDARKEQYEWNPAPGTWLAGGGVVGGVAETQSLTHS